MNRKDQLKKKLKGMIVMTDWGYSMSLPEFAKVLDETPKSLKVQMLKKKIVGDRDPSGGKAFPNLNEFEGKPFNLRKHKNWEQNLLGDDRTLRFVGRGSIPAHHSPQSWWLASEKDILKGAYQNTWD